MLPPAIAMLRPRDDYGCCCCCCCCWLLLLMMMMMMTLIIMAKAQHNKYNYTLRQSHRQRQRQRERGRERDRRTAALIDVDCYQQHSLLLLLPPLLLLPRMLRASIRILFLVLLLFLSIGFSLCSVLGLYCLPFTPSPSSFCLCLCMLHVKDALNCLQIMQYKNVAT